MNAVPKSRLGSYVSVSTVGEAVKAFVPPPLPPDPPVRLHEFAYAAYSSLLAQGTEPL